MVQKITNKKNTAIFRSSSSYKWIFYMFKVGGIATISLSTKTSDNNNKYCEVTSSKLGTAYNLFLIVTLCLSNYYSIEILCTTTLPMVTKFEKVFELMQALFSGLMAVTILALYSLKQEKAVDLINQMKVIQETSLTLDPKISFADTLKSDILKILFTNLIFWLSAILTSSVVFIDFFVYYAAFVTPQTLVNFLAMQYSVILMFIKHFFKMINSGLQEVSKSTEIYIDRRNDFNNQRILQLKRLTSMLHEFSQNVSNFYSPTIFLIIIQNFMTFIFCTYYIAKPVLIGKNNFTLFMMIHCFCCFINSFVSLWLLTKAVTNTVDESQKTGAIVSDFNGSLNQEINKKFCQFSNYLLHNKVKFKVYGLFSLDESLLVSITSSITTYMVILIQFEDKN